MEGDKGEKVRGKHRKSVTPAWVIMRCCVFRRAERLLSCVSVDAESSDRWRQGNCVSPCLGSPLMSCRTQCLTSRWVGEIHRDQTSSRMPFKHHCVWEELCCLSLPMFLWPASPDFAIFWAQRELFLRVHTNGCLS